MNIYFAGSNSHGFGDAEAKGDSRKTESIIISFLQDFDVSHYNRLVAFFYVEDVEAILDVQKELKEKEVTIES